jgi:hypothetical protein
MYIIKNLLTSNFALQLETDGITLRPNEEVDLENRCTRSWLIHDSTLQALFTRGILSLVTDSESAEYENVYDDTASELDADTLQEAIDALDVRVDANETNISTNIADITSIEATLSYLAPDDAQSMDGDTLTQSGTTLYAGKLSAGNTNYKPGNGAGSTVSYIITDATFSLLSPNQSTTFNKADEGTLILKINGVQVDSYNLATAFVEGSRAGNQTYIPDTGANGKLRIDSVGWYNSFPDWQKGNATALITPSDLRQGWNYIEMVHDLDTDQTTTAFDVFYDNDSGANPSINTPTLVENAPAFKYLSGVKLYDRASTFDLSFVVSNCFNNVYHQTSPVTCSACGVVNNITEDDASVSGLSSPPAVGETMTVTDKLLTVPDTNFRSMNTRVSITPRDPYGSYSAGQSASENRMVDAYTTTSDSANEYFDDENRRLPAGAYDSVPGAITSQWTSSDALTNGKCQVYNGSLIYPTEDFSSGYLPSQSADYSGFTGDQVYYRAMYDTDPHTNGQLNIPGSGFSDIDPVGSGDLNVEIKLPTQTGWLDLGTNYSGGSFTGSDGDGCRTSKSGDNYSWTSGSFSTADSGNMVIVRVTFRSSGVSLTQLREIGW